MPDKTIPYGQRFDYAALTFRTIDDEAEDLPPNLAVVEAADYEEAIGRLVRAARTSPVSLAVWNQPSVPAAVEDYARGFMAEAEKGDVLNGIPPGKAEVLNAYINGYFNALAKDVREADRAAHERFRYEVTKFIDAIQKKFPKRTLTLSFSRSASTDANEFHLDGPADEWKETDDPEKSERFFRPSIRFIINYDGPATCAAAADDVDFSRYQPLPNSAIKHYSAALKESFNTVWEMKPWAVGVIVNQRWHHPGSMHSGGISREPGKCENRLRLLVTVK